MKFIIQVRGVKLKENVNSNQNVPTKIAHLSMSVLHKSANSIQIARGKINVSIFIQTNELSDFYSIMFNIFNFSYCVY